MFDIFRRYGIKEVADMTFYETKGGKPGKPVLVLDTLKVSTVEQTAENTDARGGKGNSALISWDYGKEITINLEDALFSQRSLELMYGGKAKAVQKNITWTLKEPLVLWVDPANIDQYFSIFCEVVKCPEIEKELSLALSSLPYPILPPDKNSYKGEYKIVPKNGGIYPLFPDEYFYPSEEYRDMVGLIEVEKRDIPSQSTTYTLYALPAGVYNIVFQAEEDDLFNFNQMKWNQDGTFSAVQQECNYKSEIDISSNTFPGTYYVTADTFIRNETTGQDEFFQIIIPKAKIVTENNVITMEADGEPSVFNMKLKVLKPKNSPMMSLVQYTTADITGFTAWSYFDPAAVNESGKRNLQLKKASSVTTATIPVSSSTYGSGGNHTGEQSFTSSVEVAVQSHEGDGYEGSVVREKAAYTLSRSYLTNSQTTTVDVKNIEKPVDVAEIVLIDGSVLAFAGIESLEIVNSNELWKAKVAVDESDGHVYYVMTVLKSGELNFEFHVDLPWLATEEGQRWIKIMAIRFGLTVASAAFPPAQAATAIKVLYKVAWRFTYRTLSQIDENFININIIKI